MKNELIEKLIESAVPVTYAKFHSAVNNGDGTPENYFSEESNVKSRQVKMWASYAYLICFHKESYILVPLSNVVFAEAKEAAIELTKRGPGRPPKEAA